MNELSKAKLSTLKKAREARCSAEPRTAPEGWRTPEQLLDDTRDYVARYGLTVELSRYLGVNEASVRRWVKREKMPLQATLDAIANWRRIKKAGL